MGPPNAFFSSILYLFLLATFASASPFLSADGIFESGVSTAGRALLEDGATKACIVDFEKQNYTILTGQCKGPKYPPKMCCEAFKPFACPFTKVINDLTTDCAPAMFYYIKMYGKYPLGLFADNCREGPEGLDCSAVKPAKISHTVNRHGKTHHRHKHQKHQ